MRLRTGAALVRCWSASNVRTTSGRAGKYFEAAAQENPPHQPDTIDIAALATQSVPAPLPSAAFSHMSSMRGRGAAVLRQVFERSTARYLHLCRTPGRRRMKGNVLCRRQLSSFIPQHSAGCHTCKNRHPGKMSRKTSKLVLSHFVSLTFLTWLRVKDAGINAMMKVENISGHQDGGGL